jgi:hypothetical protein
MQDQLRIYTIKPGEMIEWLDEWRRLIAPLRERLGFQVLGAWTIQSENRFVWILRYSGSKSWKEADDAYYAAPERTRMQPDPARHIARAESWLLDNITAPVGEKGT